MSSNKRKSWPANEFVSKSTLHLLERDNGAPPQIAWRRKLNTHANPLTEFNVTLREALKMIKLGYRLWAYIQAERSQGRAPPIDPFSRQIRPSACHGVPLGGMGSGSIGRGFRGEFRRWQLMPGVCEEAPVLSNQFSLFVSRDGGKHYSSVLYPGRPTELGLVENSGISSWDWNLDGQHSTYHAVFPRAWTIYEGEPDPELKISCRQISPFIPNNYRESCLPSTVFSYTIVNTGKGNATVSLLFTWANSIGGLSHLSGDHFNEGFKEEDGISGVLLHHKTAKGHPPITFAIAAQNTNEVHVSICPCFSLSGKDGEFSASDMWKEVKEHGAFSEDHWNSFPISVSPPGGFIASAVAAKVSLQPHEKKTVTFSLVWDAPKVKFSKGRSYYRRYTKFYGFSGKAATRLAHDAILDYTKWEDAIIKWQEPILNNERLPEWYRFTLFNELYFLVAGGTIWAESETGTARGESLAKNRASEHSADDKFSRNHSKAGIDTKVPLDVSQEKPRECNTANERDPTPRDPSKVLNQSLSEVDRSTQSEPCGSLQSPTANENDPTPRDPSKVLNRSLSGDYRSTQNEPCSSLQSPSITVSELGNSDSFHKPNFENSEPDNEFADNGSACPKDLPNDNWVSSYSSDKAHASNTHSSSPKDLHPQAEGFDELGAVDERAEAIKLQPLKSNSFYENLGIGDSPEETHNTMEAYQNDGMFPISDDLVGEDHKEENSVGRFLYLEGLEYVMWCTYDVHFYASFALLALFPKLELCIQQEFANATLNQNLEKIKFLTDANWGVRKVVGAVPHDLGMHDPWIEVNAYNIHDTSKWKDLNCKFVLQVYRDFVVTQDMDFAKQTWPSVFAAMAYMDKFDKDRDGLIENDGFPDQTYDTWTVHGVSAYCGGLWLAALQAAASMAEKLNHSDIAKSFMAKFEQARQAYEKKLWNGAYFNYDSGNSSNSNSIQADQLAGQLYMYASCLPPLFELEKIASTLKKIFDYNVMKVKGGKLGAVNGMHPDGKVDETCMQSREIWTGVTYLLAATMISAGMTDEAFRTAEGIFHTGWSAEGLGYGFQTPEGWTINGHYRSLAYMRPLSIWAIQSALDSRSFSDEAPNEHPMSRGCSFPSNVGLAALTDALGKVQKPQMENLRICLRCLHDCMCKKR